MNVNKKFINNLHLQDGGFKYRSGTHLTNDQSANACRGAGLSFEALSTQVYGMGKNKKFETTERARFHPFGA